MLKFTDDHEWIRVEGSIGTVGITDFAQDALGDIVFVELPEVGRQLADQPNLLNSAAESEGWVYKVQLADIAELDGLMDEAAYRDFAQK